MLPVHRSRMRGITRPDRARHQATAQARLVELGPVSVVRAVEFVRPMRGASQPYLLRCENGEYYVVKFQKNPQHIRILANELLAGRLAALIGLAVPEALIVEVPKELIRGSISSGAETGSRCVHFSSGIHFGSRYPGDPHQTLVVDFLPDRLLHRVRNLVEVFLGGYVFDKWTCNCDGRQVVFFRSVEEEGSSYSASLIDHGFCFNDGEWNFPDSPIRSFYPRRIVYEDVRGFESFEPFLSRIENLDLDQLEACLKDIPEEWCGDDPGQIHRLAQRLYDRRRRLRQAMIDAKNSDLHPFANWN